MACRPRGRRSRRPSDASATAFLTGWIQMLRSSNDIGLFHVRPCSQVLIQFSSDRSSSEPTAVVQLTSEAAPTDFAPALLSRFRSFPKSAPLRPTWLDCLFSPPLNVRRTEPLRFLWRTFMDNSIPIAHSASSTSPSLVSSHECVKHGCDCRAPSESLCCAPT
jgi:hypothetical protein